MLTIFSNEILFVKICKANAWLLQNYNPYHLFLKEFLLNINSFTWFLVSIVAFLKYNWFLNKLKFVSNMIEQDQTVTIYRLLSVDANVVLPYNVWTRLLITSTDVLHSWAVPSLGIKLDACPGRLNQTTLFVKRNGFFYGQCSEICGVNHSFMPIVVEVTDHLGMAYWEKINSHDDQRHPLPTFFVELHDFIKLRFLERFHNI